MLKNDCFSLKLIFFEEHPYDVVIDASNLYLHNTHGSKVAYHTVSSVTVNYTKNG